MLLCVCIWSTQDLYSIVNATENDRYAIGSCASCGSPRCCMKELFKPAGTQLRKVMDLTNARLVVKLLQDHSRYSMYIDSMHGNSCVHESCDQLGPSCLTLEDIAAP